MHRMMLLAALALWGACSEPMEASESDTAIVFGAPAPAGGGNPITGDDVGGSTSSSHDDNDEDCNNGTDDDGDGWKDCEDQNCWDSQDCLGDELCGDGKDNDGDTFADCQDQDCFAICGSSTSGSTAAPVDTGDPVTVPGDDDDDVTDPGDNNDTPDPDPVTEPFDTGAPAPDPVEDPEPVSDPDPPADTEPDPDPEPADTGVEAFDTAAMIDTADTVDPEPEPIDVNDHNGDGIVYPDLDHDGYGQGPWPTPVEFADDTPEQGWADNGLDCDDGNPDVNPGETEINGDGIDNDCGNGDGIEADPQPEPEVDTAAAFDTADPTELPAEEDTGDPVVFDQGCDVSEVYVEFTPVTVAAGEKWEGYAYNRSTWYMVYWYALPLVSGTGPVTVGACFPATSGHQLTFNGFELGDNGDGVLKSFDDQMVRDCGQTPGVVAVRSSGAKCAYTEVRVDGVDVTKFYATAYELEYNVP